MRRGIALVAILVSGCAAVPVETRPALAIAPASAGDALLVGAGDIARCGPTLANAKATAALVAQLPDAVVFTAGDNAYPDGRAQDFTNCYEPAWGAFKARTRPVPGNHEYRTAQARPYFDYFGVAPWSSFDLNGWHIVLLDSMKDMRKGSPQLAWLESDLAAANARCIAAIWHHPRFSSGPHGLSPTDPGRRTADVWAALAQRGASVIVNGHDHHYERFAPIEGIRQFIVGTGGAELRPIIRVVNSSEVRVTKQHGILILTLRPGSYDWRFVGVDGVVRDHSDAPQTCTQLVP
jgi:acid phosphatase type 7